MSQDEDSPVPPGDIRVQQLVPGGYETGTVDFDLQANGQSLLQLIIDREAAKDAPPAKPWRPLEDPDKPSFPYLPGFSAKIQRHHIHAGTQFKFYVTEQYLKTVTQSEAVTLEPPGDAFEPAERQRRPVAGKLIDMFKVNEAISEAAASTATVGGRTETAQIVINTPIAIGMGRGAQIVSCTVTPYHTDRPQSPNPEASFQAAAKIFDPLYYPSAFNLADSPRDFVADADTDYRTEAAAYEHLRSINPEPEHSDSFAPRYYGSWTLPMPITIRGKPHIRDVQLVLLEFLNGTSIEAMRVHNTSDGHTDSFHYPEGYRLEVLARAMEGHARQLRSGLNQGDFAGRNVVLVPTPTPANTECSTGTATKCTEAEVVCGLAMPRVVLVDYNNACIWDPTTFSSPVEAAMIGQESDLWEQFGGWVPNEWMEWTDEAGTTHRGKMEWLLKRFPESTAYLQAFM